MKLIKLAAIACVALAFSGCIVIPAGPGYYHPYHQGYYGWR
jgi:hypothetical protein